ncbi:MAG TPA: RDD family protein [Spirochaetota bacterium]|nr:RDD family protein [Spirochaetota bacterium]
MRYAGFWRRAAAFFIDMLVVGAVAEITGQVFLVVFGGPNEQGIMAWGYANMVMYGLFWVYFALMESSSFHATIGKLFFDVRVIADNDKEMNFKRAVIRNLCKVPSAMILLIGFFMAGWTSKKQALHDIISGSLVIDKPGHNIIFQKKSDNGE